MKPKTDVIVYRTQNDTDLMSFVLQVKNDAGTEFVADADAVAMYVDTPDDVVTIAGVAKGDDSGTFTFDPADIKEHYGNMPFEIEVTCDADGTIYTVARGTIRAYREIA